MTEPVFATSKAELEKMVSSLDSFMKESFIQIAKGEMLKVSSAEDDSVAILMKEYEARLIQCNHHQGGAQAAKTRFMNM